jgi:pimeloyl-ACP methyl ester carboxylesterase
VPSNRQIDWTPHERDLTIEGRRLRYVEIGSGPHGFVLVHGMGGCWQHWAQTLPLLARHGRAVALDLPGFGVSQRPRGGVSLDAFADCAAQLCEAAGLRKLVFFGHSMGGPIGLRFASRYPDLARGLVMVGGAVRTFAAVLAGRGLGRLAFTKTATTVATVAEILGAGFPAPRPLKQLIAHHRLLRRLALWPYLLRPAEVSAEAAEVVLKGAGAPGVFPTARAIGRSDPYQGLGEVRCPILSVGARHDLICPATDLEHFDRIAADVRSALIEGAGHMLMLERPQAFNDLVGSFLTEISWR